MTLFLISAVCFLGGFFAGMVVLQMTHNSDMQHLGNTLNEGYFLNTLLTGLAQILFHEHQYTVFEVPVHGAVYRVYQEENDILYTKK